MYNLRDEAKSFHEKGRGNGYVLEREGRRVYFSGDTEDIPEMRALSDIDMAFVCMNLPYTMTVESAADAVLEFAQNVLGHTEAGNAEVDPECAMPVVGPLTCPLVETTGAISFLEGSALRALHGSGEVEEGYHCSYGVMATYLSLFDGSALRFTGFDSDGDPRAFELADHPFFIGTAYQPERSALKGVPHPIPTQFVTATLARMDQAA